MDKLNIPGVQQTPIPTPPAGATGRGHLRPDQLPGQGRPPLPSGEVVVSDYTRRELTKLGWKDGDPIPGDLGQRIAEIQAEIRSEKETARPDLPPDFKPPKAKMVNIDDLPPEKQAELREYLQEYKAEVARRDYEKQAAAAVEAQIPEGCSPAVAAAMRDTARAAQAAQVERAARRQASGPEVVFENGPPPGVEIPEGKVFAGSLGGPASLGEKIERLNQMQRQTDQAPAPQSAEPEVPAADAGAELPITHCPRCLWALNMAFDAHPTQQDKERFMAGVLGQSRFERKAELCDGTVVFYFRSLTAAESRVVHQQLGFDMRAGRVVGDGEYFMYLMEYRMVLALSRIETGGTVVCEVPDLKTFTNTIYKKPLPYEQEFMVGDKKFTRMIEPDPQTPLVQMVEWFYEHVAQHESIRKLIGMEHRNFQRVLEALEAMTAEPDFWKGIEPRA